MNEQPLTVIEEGRRLSESSLWQLQRAFYERWGVEAWSMGQVPYYVTNNPFIANAYARMVIGFLRDCLRVHESASESPASLPDPNQPLYIIELGAGSGRFGYLLLKRLLALKDVPPLNEVPFCYVMTDVIERNLHFWNEHPYLRPFLDEGVLDFARFDAERQQEITLLRRGITLSEKTVTNPVVVLANYVFDSMIQDAFRVEGDTLLEGLFTLISGRAHEPDPADPQILERLTIRSRYIVTAADHYYRDPDYNRILKQYRQQFADIEFLFPIGALRGIRNLMALSRGNLLLLVADKGYSQEKQLLQRDPDLDVQGSLKMEGMTVNLHAIRQYMEMSGGHALHTSPWNTSFVISACFAGSPQLEFHESRATFSEDVERFSPHHFYTLVKGIREEGAVTSIDEILSLLHLSHWDPQIVLWFAKELKVLAPSAAESLKQELESGIERAWGNYFPIGEKEDLPFGIATILQKMGRPATALRFYDRSRQLSGEHQATAFNSGLCHYQLGQMVEALRFFEAALELNPSYQKARDWKIAVESQLGV